ncbi:chromosomal replication initiator protein DnaA [Stenotrophomonas sp. Sa5BUN4]|jgi:chromosomal replication initiator protein|uniref:Chromosomal replication initiator protein DnaA n=1 Tax=Stenotrophomonas lacuserhaii TaxID=2760084 RepID=A0A8X8FV01_9GAMM|nr:MULTISPECIES: chromosomal replication initiator protein DnaA [Stenotrophomonas]KIP87694.1 chromosomal replication initiator protein DnaA [Stenotrophomonas maltophilia]MBD7953367.1 chromosomal replication initiator protein DnaA [Stenotrophomonas pennii]MDX3931884.1 chromosomal replication initiator protein DnaA [Stenotrophomonas sp.]PKH72792.1 chromosomal replication initiator protein DnaA [Stenotrophomonas sp. Betaine-02u-23]PKH75249.1 chromosomal replication initiator protein DnaA [Stenotr
MDAWSRCLERLEAEFPPEDVHTWLKPLQADLRADALILFAPNAFIVDQVRSLYLPRIRELLTHFAGFGDVFLEIGSRPRPMETQIASNPGLFSGGASPALPPAASAPVVPFAGNMDSHYTFANFVEGRSNQLGLAAAFQAAQRPGDRAHNPLLLYGGTGLGKTHLMFAAGNAMREANPHAKVLYLRSEQFFSAMIRALQEKTMDQFKRQFQQVDALLIDDIQFFAGKDRTQEEFFHTFNALFDGKQQIILTCDRYPREVEGLEARLKSRLAWGLSVAIEPPDFETRAAIVLAKARERGAEIPDDVAFLIAKKMRSNVRDLEGALNTLTARANFTGRAITTEFAQETLRDLLRAQQQAISIPNIQKTVADYYGLQIKDLLSKRRTRSLARPRQVAMALTKELTEHSLPEIGDAFAGRDHTTVLHGCRQIRTLMETDGKLREDWDKLIRKLSE